MQRCRTSEAEEGLDGASYPEAASGQMGMELLKLGQDLLGEPVSRPGAEGGGCWGACPLEGRSSTLPAARTDSFKEVWLPHFPPRGRCSTGPLEPNKKEEEG